MSSSWASSFTHLAVPFYLLILLALAVLGAVAGIAWPIRDARRR